MSATRVLLICRSRSDWSDRHNWLSGQQVIVASDDPRVHELARGRAEIAQVVFLEPLSSFYTVAPAVRAIVERLDDHLAACAPQMEDALRWGCTVEGGMTSQRVQDALLLIDAYHDLLDRTSPDAIVVRSASTEAFADEVLVAVARHRGVSLRRETPAPRLRLWVALRQWFRPWALLAYRLVHFCRRGGARSHPRGSLASSVDGRVVFLLCSAANNHWDNIRSVARELTRNGSGSTVLTWLAHERISRPPTDPALAVRALEPWVGLRNTLSCLVQAARLARRLRCALAAHANEFTYRGIVLAPSLHVSLRHFTIAELPLRLLFRRALFAALRDTRPTAVKPWGAPEGFEYRQLANLWPRECRPLLFQYWLGVGMSWPYADPRQPLDLFLAKNRDEAAQFCADYERSEPETAVIGPIRLAGHREFARGHPATDSRARLGLEEVEGALWIGFDPNCALRGYQSAREQVAMTESLLEAVRRAPALHLLVKPHPAYPINHLEPLFKSASRRVVLLPSRAPLDHFLNSVDLVVSKYSTLLLEAALMRRIALPVIPGGDSRFRVFGALAPVISDLPELVALLVRLAEDRSARLDWLAARLADQERYLEENGYLPGSGDLPAARAATAILAHATRGPQQ